MKRSSLMLIKDWVIKGYHCAYCGTNKSVKYFSFTPYGDTVPLCNKCVMKNTINRTYQKEI